MNYSKCSSHMRTRVVSSNFSTLSTQHWKCMFERTFKAFLLYSWSLGRTNLDATHTLLLTFRKLTLRLIKHRTWFSNHGMTGMAGPVHQQFTKRYELFSCPYVVGLRRRRFSKDWWPYVPPYISNRQVRYRSMPFWLMYKGTKARP